MVEFDMHPTTDGDFVVFHDWTLDCRTDGTGVTRTHSLAELKALDIGYGYTADGGKTYPFRGLGVGLMPTLAEVLTAFPNQRFLINIKSNDADEGRRLGEYLGGLKPARQALLMVYGGGRAIAAFRRTFPAVAAIDVAEAKRCLKRYALLGWLGAVPVECRQTLLFVPANLTWLAWGYPNRLAARLARHGTRLVVIGPYDNTGFSSGVDEMSELAGIPAKLDGAIWTNRVDRIGPAVAAR